MSVFEIGRTISESTGGKSVSGSRFFFTDDSYCELGLQRGNSYDVRIRLKGNTSGHIKLTMIGHRGYAPNAGGNRPFCYIVEALPQQMGTRATLSSTATGIDTKSFDDGIEGQRITILINDTNTNFTHDVRTLYLNGGANWTAGTTGDSIEFVYNGSEWIETNRSDNT